MADTPIVHDTFVLERQYPKPPERVFRALSDPAQKRRWFAEDANRDDVAFSMRFEVGGAEESRYAMGAQTPFPGVELSSVSHYLDIVDGARVVLAQAMTLGGRRISAALITFEVTARDGGATLTLTHQAAFFEGSDGPQMRKGGWESLMDRLGRALA